MSTLRRRIERLELHRPARVGATHELLRRLSLAELEALEGAVLAPEAGAPLAPAQEAALAAWERLAESDEEGRAWAG